jgi:uncharacterized protein YqcC (DUF446 family)
VKEELPASRACEQPLAFPWSEDTARRKGWRQWLLISRRRASHTQYVRLGGATRLSAFDDSSKSNAARRVQKRIQALLAAEETMVGDTRRRWGLGRIERAASSRTLPVGKPSKRFGIEWSFQRTRQPKHGKHQKYGVDNSGKFG